MFEKVNPSHPDKVADRIAGAIVDIAYKTATDPKVAVEVLIGHNRIFIINETSEKLDKTEIGRAIKRIVGSNTYMINYAEIPQDVHLAENQATQIRCGDNGIFKGCPISQEEKQLTETAHTLYDIYNTDGKYITYVDPKTDETNLIICQSNAEAPFIEKQLKDINARKHINPLGYWTGGANVDTGATNRKLGSDMGRAVTGGGLHGKDLSKADVSVNIYAHLIAQNTKQTQEFVCAIGDTHVTHMNTGFKIPYTEIVETARQYIKDIGGFEKLAEWGLIR